MNNRFSIHNTALVSMADRGPYCPAMSNQLIFLVAGVLVTAIVAIVFIAPRLRNVGRPIPANLRRGRPLPDFQATDESGDPVRSTQLHGTAAVILFVRGNWCLLEKAGVPEDHRKEYGEDTVWPTALVVDRNGMIVYSYLSKSISDRPDAKVLLQALAKAQSR